MDRPIWYNRDGTPKLDEFGRPSHVPPERDESWIIGKSYFINPTDGAGFEVSTVFLGIDHGFTGPVPILFETMIFTHPRVDLAARAARSVGAAESLDGEQWRYATEEAAITGHREACTLVRLDLAAHDESFAEIHEQVAP